MIAPHLVRRFSLKPDYVGEGGMLQSIRLIHIEGT
jgi:hypothetical protein